MTMGFEKALRKHGAYVCKIANGSVSDVATVGESGSLAWGKQEPVLLEKQSETLREHASEVATSSSRLTMEGCAPIILVHESVFEKHKDLCKELIFHSERLNDFGKPTFLNKIFGTIHYTVLDALLSVKAEGQCIDCGFRDDIIDKIELFTLLSVDKLCAEDYRERSDIIENILYRYIYLSFLELKDSWLKSDLLSKLKTVLIRISERETQFGEDRVFLNIKPSWDIRRDVITLKPTRWPSEEHNEIAGSVNRIVGNIARPEPQGMLSHLAFQEGKMAGTGPSGYITAAIEAALIGPVK